MLFRMEWPRKSSRFCAESPFELLAKRFEVSACMDSIRNSVRGYYLFCPKTANLHEAEMIENLPETYQLEHLGGLGPEIV